MGDKVLFKTLEKEIFVDGAAVPDRKAIVNADNQKVIGIVSNVYKVVNNKQVLDHFTNILDGMKMKYEFKGGKLIRNGSKTIMHVEFPNTELTVAKNDILKLQSYLVNGFDGFSKAKLILGYIRLVCTNGMVIGTDEMTISYKHVGSVNEKIVETFRGYIEEKLKATRKYVEDLRTIKLPVPIAENIIDEKSDWLSQKYLPLVKDQIEESKKDQVTAWDLYNAYTYVMSHSMPNVNQENLLELHRRLYVSSKGWIAEARA